MLTCNQRRSVTISAKLLMTGKDSFDRKKIKNSNITMNDIINIARTMRLRLETEPENQILLSDSIMSFTAKYRLKIIILWVFNA